MQVFYLNNHFESVAILDGLCIPTFGLNLVYRLGNKGFFIFTRQQYPQKAVIGRRVYFSRTVTYTIYACTCLWVTHSLG